MIGIILLCITIVLTRFTTKAQYPSKDIQLCGHFRMEYLLFDETNINNTVLNKYFGYARVIAMEYMIQKIVTNSSYFLGTKLRVRYFDGLTLKVLPTKLLPNRCDFIIGPYSSYATENAISLFGPINVPIISHGATSHRFKNRHYFKNVFRTVPDNSIEATILVAMATKYNWMYIGMLYSDNDGEDSLNMEFSTKMTKQGFCIPVKKSIKHNLYLSNYTETIKSVVEKCEFESVEVLFLFLSHQACYSLYEAIKYLDSKTKNKLEKLQLVMGSNCATNIQINKETQEYFKNMITIQIQNKIPDDFEDYFNNRSSVRSRPFDTVHKIDGGTLDDFKEYWNMYQGCSRYTEDCRPSNLTKLIDNPVLSPIFEATRIALQAIRYRFLECTRRYKSGSYDRYRCKHGAPGQLLALDYLNKLNEQRDEEMSIQFNDSGGVSTNFDIFRYKLVESIEEKEHKMFAFSKIGSWDRKFGLNISEKLRNSMCSQECRPTEIKILSDHLCCWHCETCPNTKIIVKNKCVSCSEGFKPNLNQTECDPLKIYKIAPTTIVSISIMLVSCLGLILALLILIIYAKHYKTKVIKASSRELSLVSLGGLVLMLITPVVFIQSPSGIVCGMQKFLFGLSLTCCYAPLVLKTNRVYRIFLSSQKFKLKKLIFVSITSQMSIIAGMLGIQILICIFWIITDNQDVTVDYNKNEYGTEVCYTTTLTLTFNLSFPLVLMIASTFWAFKTRNLPESFSEIKSIGVTMYITLFIFIAALALIFVFNANEDETYMFSEYYILCYTWQSVAIVTLIGQHAMKFKLIYSNQEFDTTIDTTEFTSVSTNKYTTKIMSPNLNEARNIRMNNHTIAHSSPTTRHANGNTPVVTDKNQNITLSPKNKQFSLQL